jgi:peptidoglycan/LPS O-acetylase OafA/YrhL
MRQRYVELDSLRGLAATTVVLSHLAVVLPNLYVLEKFKNTPFQILWAGHEAVILFFLLSGFVLSLPFYTNNQLVYRDYLIRRICRIYIPYIVSVFMAMILMTVFSGTAIPGMLLLG